jgi:hypothetical protein
LSGIKGIVDDCREETNKSYLASPSSDIALALSVLRLTLRNLDLRIDNQRTGRLARAIPFALHAAAEIENRSDLARM